MPQLQEGLVLADKSALDWDWHEDGTYDWMTAENFCEQSDSSLVDKQI